MRISREHIHAKRSFISLQRLFTCSLISCALSILFPTHCIAQEPGQEEILVSINIQGMGTIEVPAIIDEQTLYLPIVDIFDYLKIKIDQNQSFDTISGFYISQEQTYLIDRIGNKIFFRENEIPLAKDALVKTETSLYMKSEYFGSVFDLPSAFNFRALFVNMSSKNELPVMRDARLEAIRGNLRRLKGEIIADTNFQRVDPWIHFGMTDWSVIAAQQSDGTRDTRVNLGLGAIVLGGEVNASINYSTSIPFQEKQQFYSWRYVNNDARAVKQVAIGKIPTMTVASIFAPVLGAGITNTPTIAKRAFGSYRLSDITEPGWVVELYVNNILVDYVRADETGFFSFNVPLVYGNSAVKLRYYGPFGEERTKDQNISIPFNFMSPGKFEYTAMAGVVEDDTLSKLARGGITYGLNRYITIGTGVEYLSSVTTSPVMPYVNTAARLGSGILLFGEYNYKVRAKGGVFYRTVSNWQFEATYTLYEKGQKAINNNALEERRAVVSVPMRLRRLSMFSMLTFNQTVLPSTSYTTTEWLFSGTYKRVDVRLNTIGIAMPETKPLLYTNFAIAVRLPYGFAFTPEAQYQYTLNEFLSMKGALEKRVLRRGYVGVIYEENFKSRFRNIGIQLRYDFDYAQAGFTGRLLNNKFSFLEAARGGLMYDRQTNYTGFTNTASIGRSGIVLLPFLDMNCNGYRDEDEPKVSGLKFRINVGRIQPEGRDTTIRITGIEPYNNYFIELNRLSFDNVAWLMNNKTLRVFAEPNMFRLIEVPISVVGEATGTVNLLKRDAEMGQGQILVNIYQNDSFIAKALTEPDGYFSYMGLAPGRYVAMVDTVQLRKINMTASAPRPFTIITTKDGDVVEGLDFTLQSLFDTATAEQTSINIPDTEVKKVVKATKVKKVEKPKLKPAAKPVVRAKNYKSFQSPMAAARRPAAMPKPASQQANTKTLPVRAKPARPKVDLKSIATDPAKSTNIKKTLHLDSNHRKEQRKAVEKNSPAIDSTKSIEKTTHLDIDSGLQTNKHTPQQVDSFAIVPGKTFKEGDSTQKLYLPDSISKTPRNDSVNVTIDTVKSEDLTNPKGRKSLLKNLRRFFGTNKE